MDKKKRVILFIACLSSGIVILAARWIPNETIKILYSLCIALFFLALSLLLKRNKSKEIFWKLSFVFFIFGLVQLLNNSVPFYFQQYVLKEMPSDVNPLGSTIFGSAMMQLVESVVAIIPIILLTKVSGENLQSVYLNKGKFGKWFFVSIVAFFVFYILAFRASSHSFFLTGNALSFQRFLLLSPVLLLMVISNGLQEELLFRGLFLKKFNHFFGTLPANVLQAGIFTIAHIGITYTSSTAIFLTLLVFPLGLFMGSLMRKTDSIIAPSIFHAGTDIPIYLSFLTHII